MNNHVPYIWRKNYCNNGPWPEKVLQTAHEKARQYLNCRYIINSLLQKYGCWHGLIRHAVQN